MHGMENMKLVRLFVHSSVCVCLFVYLHVILLYLLCAGFTIDQRSVKEEEKEDDDDDNNYDDNPNRCVINQSKPNC